MNQLPVTITVRRILAPNPGPMTNTGTNTYLVDDGLGTVVAIDPGPDDHPDHLARIEAEANEMGRLKAILVTHGHLDHLPGALPIRSRTGAPIFGHSLLPSVDGILGDGQLFRAGEIELVAFETPGHTRDSLSFWDERTRRLFTGDMIAGVGSVVVDGGRGALARYMLSLHQLYALGDCTMFPGHGPLVEDGQGKAGEYLEHRSQREREVVAALQVGCRTVAELVEAIYPEVVAALVPMAGRNVLAHLHKLEDEGRVVKQASDWLLLAE